MRDHKVTLSSRPGFSREEQRAPHADLRSPYSVVDRVITLPKGSTGPPESLPRVKMLCVSAWPY